MRKELTIAIISGLTVGLLVAFGAWRFKSTLNPQGPTPNNNQQEAEVSKNSGKTSANSNSDAKGITFSNPSEFDVVTETPIRVAGIVKGDGNIVTVVSGESEDKIINSKRGEFDTEIEVIPGINRISVSSWDKKNPVITKDLLIVYSSEFKKYLSTEELTEGNTASSESVLDKVKEKVESLRKNPKAIIGSITDKTEETLQVQNMEGKIELISISDSVEYVRLGKTKTDVEFADIAIGDFVAALGFSSVNGVLEAKRIILSDPVDTDKRSTAFGKITSIKGKTVNLKTTENQELTLTFPKSWEGPEIKELEDGQELASVYLKSNNDLAVRTIQIISNSENTQEQP